MFDPLKHDRDKEIAIQRNEKKIYEGSLRFRPGLHLWEINNVTHEIRQLDPKEDMEIIEHMVKDKTGMKPGRTRRIKRNPDCLYVQAINKKNALKKLFAHFGFENPKKMAEEFLNFKPENDEQPQRTEDDPQLIQQGPGGLEGGGDEPL